MRYESTRSFIIYEKLACWSNGFGCIIPISIPNNKRLQFWDSVSALCTLDFLMPNTPAFHCSYWSYGGLHTLGATPNPGSKVQASYLYDA